MRTDIIVLTYGNEELSCKCFESLRKYTTDYRLIWVDNGSGHEAIDVMLPEARANPVMIPMFLSKNIGFIKGTNIALKLLLEVFNTDADFIVLLNNDVIVTDGWLDRMIQVMEKDHKLGAVGPITSECSSWQSFKNARGVIPQFQIPAGFEREGMHKRAERLDYCYGDLAAKCTMLAFFCTVFRTSVFRELGFLDEAFGIGYGDDDDLSKRMRDAKMQLAVSMGTYVFHNHQSTFKKLFTSQEIVDIKKERLAVYREKHGEDAKV